MGFQVAWFACVFWATHDHLWLSPLAVLLLLPGHFETVPEWQQAVRRILFIGQLEMFVGSLLGFVGGLQYRDGLGAGWICPFWVVFATTLKLSLSWREGRYVAELLVEGIFGPLNYYGGHAAGALRVRGDLVDGLLVLMVLWTVLLPGLLWRGTASNLKQKMERG